MRSVFRLANKLRLRMRTGVLIELGKDRRSLHLVARRGPPQWNGLAPGRAVAFVNQLRNWDLRKIGIAQKFGAVEEGALKGLGGQVNARARAVPLLGQVVAFENVENFHQRHASRRRRRSADDLVAAIRPANRLPLLDLV